MIVAYAGAPVVRNDDSWGTEGTILTSRVRVSGIVFYSQEIVVRP